MKRFSRALLVVVLGATSLVAIDRHLASAAFDTPDEPRPTICRNSPDTPPGCSSPLPDSWLGDLTIAPEIVSEGDSVTMTWQDFGVSIPAWQGYDPSCTSNVGYTGGGGTCTFIQRDGGTAPKPAELAKWSNITLSLYNGVGPASEGQPFYVRPSRFWYTGELRQSNGTPLTLLDGVSVTMTRRATTGKIYPGDSILSLLFRWNIDRPGGQTAAMDAVKAANPSLASFGINDKLPPGPINIPASAGLVVHPLGSADNRIQVPLRFGTYDAKVTDAAGRLFAPFVVTLTNDNVSGVIQAQPDPLVVTAVRAPTQVDPVGPYDVQVDVKNQATVAVSNVSIAPTFDVLPRAAGGAFYQSMTPFSRASLPAGATQTFTFQVVPQQKGRMQIGVIASGTVGTDPVKSARATKEVRLGAPGIVATLRLDDSRIATGEQTGGTLTVYNSGDTTVTDVKPGSISLGDGLRLISGPDPASAASLASGASALFQYRLEATAVGNQTVKIPVTAKDGATTLSDTATTTIQTEGIVVELVDPPGDLEAGVPTELHVKVTSNAFFSIDDVIVDDPLKLPGSGAGDFQILSRPTGADVGFSLDGTGSSRTVTFLVQRSATGSFGYSVRGSGALTFVADRVTDTAKGRFGTSLTIAEVVADPEEPEVGEPFTIKVRVRNDGDDAITGVTTSMATSPSDLAKADGAGTPATVDLDPGEDAWVEFPYLAEATGEIEARAQATGTTASGPVTATPKAVTITLGDPAITIDLQGEHEPGKASFTATATITNLLDEPITDITWGSGLGVEVVGAGGASVVRSSGPRPVLPTSLEAGQVLTVGYDFAVLQAGTTVLTLKATGEAASLDGPAKGAGALSVEVADRAVQQDDLDQAGIKGIEQALSVAASGKSQMEAILAKGTQTTIGFTDQPSAAQVTAAAELGLPADMAGFLQQGLDQQFAFWEGYGQAFRQKIDEMGASGGEALAAIVSTMEDPVRRRALAEGIYKGAKELGPAAWENLGYLGTVLKQLPTTESLSTIEQANTNLLNGVTEGVQHTISGARDLQAQAAADYKKDPLGYSLKNGQTWGSASAVGVKEAAIGVLGEVGTRGVVAVGGRLLERAGLGALEAEANVAEQAGREFQGYATESTANAASRRMALAETATKTVQELGYGTRLTEETLATSGILPSDAKAIDDIIGEVQEKFGVDLEIIARTSEPASAAIEGTAKIELIKPKAGSALDRMMGLDDAASGQVSVFDPKPLKPDVLAGLEAKTPGFTAKYEQRLADQQKMWKDWKDPNSTIRQLADGSKRHKDGVTALISRPGAQVPEGIVYLEQLDEPAFLASRGISGEQAAALREQLAVHPHRVRVDLQTRTVNGTTTFLDGTKGGRPYVSDLDLQAVRPRDGKWPKGVNRGEVEAYVNRRMKETVGRYPNHGWSDSGFDIPAEYFEAAAKFTLNTAHPDVAAAAARDLSGRFQTMAKRLRDQAALTIDPDVQARLIAQAEKFEANTPEALLKKYPPGEKTVNFTKGDIRVGSGTGGR